MKVNYNQSLSGFIKDCEVRLTFWHKIAYSISSDYYRKQFLVFERSYWRHHAKRLGHTGE